MERHGGHRVEVSSREAEEQGQQLDYGVVDSVRIALGRRTSEMIDAERADRYRSPGRPRGHGRLGDDQRHATGSGRAVGTRRPRSSDRSPRLWRRRRCKPSSASAGGSREEGQQRAHAVAVAHWRSGGAWWATTACSGTVGLTREASPARGATAHRSRAPQRGCLVPAQETDAEARSRRRLRLDRRGPDAVVASGWRPRTSAGRVPRVSGPSDGVARPPVRDPH